MSQAFSRQSNMELLRVISMILILVIHADFYSVPYSVPRWFIVEGADAGVNCFILISGYFGIHPKWKSFSSFIFQILFFICVCNLFIINAIGGSELLSYNILNFSWFINSYIALYVFAPVLNTFAENASKQQFRCLLILWALVEFFLGYTVDYLKFERGYSFQAFIFLYLLARYIRIYGGGFASFNKYIDLLLYILLTLTTAVLMCLGENMGKSVGVQYYFRAYNSPLMIAASTFLLLFFSKIRIQSIFINRLGLSAYSAFLFHAGLFSWYRYLHHTFYLQHHWLIACVFSLGLIFAFFVIAIIIDQFRLIIWKTVWKASYFLCRRVSMVFTSCNFLKRK